MVRRNRKKKIIIPGMWFHSMSRDEQLQYRYSHRPPGCEMCKDYPIHSNDSMKTWMCGDCQHNAFKPKKNPHISSYKGFKEEGGMITPPKKIQF